MTEQHEHEHDHHHHLHDHDERPHLDESFVPVRRREIASVEVDGETVCYNTENTEVHVLNPTATLVWECLQVPGPLSDLIDDIAEELALERPVVHEHVIEAVQEMVANGLVDAEGEQPPPPPGRADESHEPRADDGQDLRQASTQYLAEPPTSCMARVDDLGWAGSVSVRAGRLVLGVRANSDEVLSFLRALLRDHLEEDDAPPNYSVRIVPSEPGASLRDLQTMYRSCELTIRSKFATRVVQGLLAHLSAQVATQEGGAPRYAALGFVADGRMVLGARRFRAVLEKLEPRLNANGITVFDAPTVELAVDGSVVVPQPRFLLDAEAQETLAKWDAYAEARRELPPVPAGRYELAGFVFEEAGAPVTPAMSVLGMLAQVSNIAALDGQAALEVLGRAQASVESRWETWLEPQAIVAAATELLASRT